MLRNTNKEWERRKWYLVRSLFENEPLLSPIPETQEQSLSPTEIARSRPYSPLPDLIIEKEPNRHDEPEEYYQELETKIKKIYKRLFRKIRTSQDSSIEDIYEINAQGANMEDETIEERTQSEHSSIGSRQSSEKRCSREEIKKFDEKNESIHLSSNNGSGSNDSINSSSVERSNKKSADSFIKNLAIGKSTNSYSSDASVVNSKSGVESSSLIENNDKRRLSDKSKSTRSILEESSSSMSISQHTTIVTTAQIHDNGSKQLSETKSQRETATPLDKTSRDDQPVHCSLPEKTEDSGSADINVVSTNTEISEAVDEDSEELESLQSSANQDEIMEHPCSEASDSSSFNEPETMRRRNASNISLQSANAFDDRCSSPGEELEEPSSREMEAEASADFSVILGSSTPKVQRYSKRRILSEIFASPGLHKRCKQNLATQTSFSTTEDENDWQEIKTTFFEGTPCIFKLCSCSNHVCR